MKQRIEILATIMLLCVTCAILIRTHAIRQETAKIREVIWDVPSTPTFGGIDLIAEPNNCSTEAIVLDITNDVSSSMIMSPDSGGELWFHFAGDGLDITGDANMTDSARMFFYEFLKPMADDYIAERISGN